MKRSIDSKISGWGICSTYPDGQIGWIFNDKTSLLLFGSKSDAERHLAKLIKSTHYSWGIPTEVRWFEGFSKNKKE